MYYIYNAGISLAKTASPPPVICHQAYARALQARRDRGPTSVSVATNISSEDGYSANCFKDSL